MDKMMVWGAWVLMAGVGTLSAWNTSQAPKVEPWVARMEAELNPKVAVMAPPPPVPVWNNPWDKNLLVARPITKGGDVPPPDGRELPPPPPPPPTNYFVLPYPTIQPAAADLNGTTITWTLQDAPLEKLPAWKIQKPAKPTGFIIKRQAEGKQEQEIAKVGPEVRSYTDLSAEPRQTYRYRVLVTGEETKRSSYPPEKETVTKGLDKSAEAKAPSNVRVKLVGGDRTNAVVRVGKYDRSQKKWIADKTVVAAPGRDIAKSGWTLKGLRFDNFTLVADVTDDEGVDRVLDTRN